jgi:hypothetical protein
MQTGENQVSPAGNRLWLRPALVALFLVVISAGAVVGIQRGLLPAEAGLVAVGLLLAAILWALRRHAAMLLLVFSAALLLSVIVTHRIPKLRPDRLDITEGEALAARWAESGVFDSSLPIVVHLGFDELMSVGAIPTDVPGGEATAARHRELARKHSFRLYESVYSRHFFSGDTFPTLMGNEYLGLSALADQKPSFAANAYFTDLAQRGYRTVVFQNDLLNFCADPNVDMCETFNAFDPGGAAGEGLDPRNQRAALWQTIIRTFEPSFTSEAGKALLASVYGLQTGEVGVIGAAGRFDVQRFPAGFDRFTRFAANVPRGTHLFGYFMVPHSPYLLSEDCFVSGKFEGGYYLGKYPEEEREQLRRDNYGAYLAQTRCLQSKVDQFMSAVSAMPDFHDAVFVIHGDHGSRISIGNMLEDFDTRDFIDNYPTYFAIRAPGVAPGVDCEFTSLPQIFRKQMSKGGGAPDPPLPVFVDRRAGGRVEAPMPRFGCGGTEAHEEMAQ